MAAPLLKSALLVLFLTGCGLKVINPNDPDNTGTLALDASGGNLKLVGTFTCKIESMGKRFFAVGKTEEEAQAEAIAKCKDNTLLSFCESKNVTCTKN